MKLYVTILNIVFSCLIFPQDYWQKIQTPIELNLNTLFCLDSSNIWVGADSGKVLFTPDQGKTWRINETGRNENLVKIFFLDENYGWGIVHYEEFPEYRTIILKTTNGGVDWSYSFYPIDNIFLYSIVFFDTAKGWVGGDIELAYTEDGGQNWYAPVVDSTFLYFPVYDLKFFDEEIGYAVGGYIDFVAVIWVTIDSGKTWNSSYATADPIFAIHIFDENYAYALTSDLSHNFSIEVLKTYNRGNDWTNEALDLYGTVSSISFRTIDEGWATMGRDKLALLTLDGGESWEYFPMVDSAIVNDVEFIDSLNGFMVGDSGRFFVYKPKDPTSVLDIDDVRSPKQFHLFQNYPNPFNAQTEIRYFLENESFVSLKLFNLLGEEIKIIDIGMKNRGTHSLNVALDDIPSGVYLYQLQINYESDSHSITKKMVLLK